MDGWATVLGPNNRPRYGSGIPMAFMDGHVKWIPFERTYKSADNNMWDLN